MKAARTPARKIPGRRFLFRKGRGAGMTRPKNRPPAGKGMAPVRTKNKSLTTGLTHGRTFVSGTYTSRKSKLIPATNKYDTKIPGREYSRTTHPGISDEDANRPHHRTVQSQDPARGETGLSILPLPPPCSAPGRITSSCRRWSSWQPSERRSWRQRPSERRSSGPSSCPRQRWHPRRRRSSSQRSCANGASWASPP